MTYTPNEYELRGFYAQSAVRTGQAGSYEEASQQVDRFLAAEEARIRADQSRLIAEAIRECIDWSSGRMDYGDNAGYEDAARIAEEAS